MSKKLYYLRISLAFVVLLLSGLAFAGVFYQIKIFDWQIFALVQRAIIGFGVGLGIMLALLVLATVVGGRVYCSVLELVFARRRNLQKNRPYKYLIAAGVLGMMLGGSAALGQMIEPYSLFGKALSGACYVCPVGAILGLMAKHSLLKIYIDDKACVACGACASKCQAGCIDIKNKTVDNETCVKCLKCLSVCKKSAIRYGKAPKQEPKFDLGRRKLLTLGAAMAVLAVAAKSGMIMAQNAIAKVKKVVLPAGAKNEKEFVNRCLNCNLCVASCPMKIIKQANDDFGAVHLDYSSGFCDYDCHECSRVCPSGAIERISLEQKQKTQIGLAVIDEKKCIKCGLCVMSCPREAIAREMGQAPKIDDTNCIGCGACKAKCSVAAISMTTIEEQKVL